MRKFMSALSVLLAAAMMLMAVPVARAAQVTLEAGGVVLQSVTANEAPSVPLATVHEGNYAARSVTNDWNGPVLNGSLTLFAGAVQLQPGATNGAKGAAPASPYRFVLVNDYTGPIDYTFTSRGLVNGTESGVIAYKLTKGAPNGTVPLGGYVEFELEWEWKYYVSPASDAADTALGENSAVKLAQDSARTTYKAELKFVIQADEPAGAESKWPDWLLPGVLGGTAIAGGGLLAALASVPLWALLLALPVIAAVWCCTKLPAIRTPASKDKKPDQYVMPPKTGESWNAVLPAGLGMALAAGVIGTMLLRRRREEAEFC